MAYSNYFFFVVDEDDKPIPNAIVTITVGGNLANIYKNRSGTPTVDHPSGLLSNPIFSARDGRVSFYADPGDYDIEIISAGETAEYTINIGAESSADEYYRYQNTIKNIDGEIAHSIISIKNKLGQSLIYSDEGVTPIANPINSDGNLDFYIKHGRYNLDLGTTKFYDVLIPASLMTSFDFDYSYSTPTPAAFVEINSIDYGAGSFSIGAGVSSVVRTDISSILMLYDDKYEDSFLGITTPSTVPEENSIYYQFENGLYFGYVDQTSGPVIFISGTGGFIEHIVKYTSTGGEEITFDSLYARGAYAWAELSDTSAYDYGFIWDTDLSGIPSSFSGNGGTVTLSTPILFYTGSSEDGFAENYQSGLLEETGGYIGGALYVTGTYTINNNSIEPLDDGWNVRVRAQSGNVTIIQGSGVTITPPAGGTLVIPEGYAAKITRTGLNTFTMTGVTVPV